MRCLSCGSHSAIEYDESGNISIVHLPEGRPQKGQARTPPAFIAAWVFAMSTVLCAGTLNFSWLSPSVTPPKAIDKPSEDAEAKGTNQRPDAPPSPEGLQVDKDIPPLILPGAVGMIVIRVNGERPETAEGPAVLIALDPATQQKLWEIPEVAMDTATGWVGTPEHIVTLEEDGTIVIINAADGETQKIDATDGRPQELCKDKAGEIYLEMRGGQSQRINANDGSSTPAENQHPCSDREEPPEACRESSQAMTRSSECTGPSHAPKSDDIEGKFTLKDDNTNVLVGTDPATRTKIILMGFETGEDGATWVAPVPLEGEGPMEQSSAELADGTLYVAARNEGEPWSLVAMNGDNGEAMWSTPLDETESSSMDRGINVVDGTVYLLDDQTLHRIDAATGKLLDELQPSVGATE